MPRTIVAVAIGAAYKQIPINDPNNIPAGVRKYVNGFVNGDGVVNGFPHVLGNDYTIDYRECPAAQLGTLVFTNQLQADFILCFSTTVVIAAAQAYSAATNKPIIGNTSQPQNYNFSHQQNVCGVSAERSDDALDVYRHFLNTVNPALNQATVLSDPNYGPSQGSLHKIHSGNIYPPVVNVSTPADVQNAINNAVPGSGVLLLPVDWMFGSANVIIGWAINRRILDFWFVTDWVVQTPKPSAFGGYGVSQETTGAYMAQQCAVTWNGNWPNPAWMHVQNHRTWLASQTRAVQNPNYPNVTLNPNNPPAGPGKVA
jgi:hypothetical protein